MIVRLLARVIKWPRKHRYRCINQVRRIDNTTIAVYQCCGCQDTRHMDRWQARSITWQRARCPSGKDLTLSEAMQVWLSPDYTMLDCYETGGM